MCAHIHTNSNVQTPCCLFIVVACFIGLMPLQPYLCHIFLSLSIVSFFTSEDRELHVVHVSDCKSMPVSKVIRCRDAEGSTSCFCIPGKLYHGFI